jgi:hypothetical protein
LNPDPYSYPNPDPESLEMLNPDPQLWFRSWHFDLAPFLLFSSAAFKIPIKLNFSNIYISVDWIVGEPYHWILDLALDPDPELNHLKCCIRIRIQ